MVPRRLLAAALVLSAVAACGTTVPLADRTGTGTGDQHLGGGSEQGGATGGTGGGVAPGELSSGSTSAAGGASTGRRATGGGSASSVGAPGPVAGRTNGIGVTDTTITIGLTYAQSAATANAAVGASGIDEGDPVPTSRLLFDDINAHGGIAGRKVVLLTYAVDPQSAEPYAAEGQAACTYFTQDHKVFAVIDGAAFAEERACLEKHHVLHLGGGLISAPVTQHEFDAYGTRLSRVFSVLADALAQGGWFGGWDRLQGKPGTAPAKTGIVTADDPTDNAAINHQLLPALRHLGHAPSPQDIIRITPPQGFGDDGAVVAGIDNAVLKLSADGVDHVFLNDGNGSLSLLFQNYALSQHYFPRYGGTSGNGWQTLLSAGDLPKQTMAGAMGIGWQPLLDLPFEQGAGPYATTARKLCFALFTRHGYNHTDAASAAGQAEGCDVGYLLAVALRSSRGPLDMDVATRAIEALGRTYPVASGLGSLFAPGQHDGTGAWSFMSYGDACSCMSYSRGVHLLP